MMLLPLVMLAAQAVPSTQDAPPEVTRAAGPRGTSGEVREDLVGYAGVMTVPPEARFAGVAIVVSHPTLPPGTLVELTALDTGRTILAMVVARDAGAAVVAVSPAAAQALGLGDRAGVRVRTVVASAQDDRALRSGQAASPRLDAPPTLLTALRRKLPQDAATVRAIPVRAPAPAGRVPMQRPLPVPRFTPDRPTVAPARAAPAAVRGGLLVQVAALSSAPRAAALAQQLGGRVVPLGKLYRVQLGPFADTASAQRARDGAARRGYGDARIIHTD